MPSDEEAALPRGKQIRRVERHAARTDDRIPVVARLLHPFFLRDVAGNRRAAVLDAVRDRRPAVVLPFPRDVDLVAAARAVLDLPQLAGLRMKRRSLHVAMAERPDLVTHALRRGKRIVLRNRAIGVEADDLPEQTVHPL